MDYLATGKLDVNNQIAISSKDVCRQKWRSSVGKQPRSGDVSKENTMWPACCG